MTEQTRDALKHAIEIIDGAVFCGHQLNAEGEAKLANARAALASQPAASDEQPYLYAHADGRAIVALPSQATFTAGEPAWVRQYPVAVHASVLRTEPTIPQASDEAVRLDAEIKTKLLDVCINTIEEIKDDLAEAGHPTCNENGNLVRNALRALIAERDALASIRAADHGHGHVYPRADGSKARCGGPVFCKLCSQDAAARQMQQIADPAQQQQPAGAVSEAVTTVVDRYGNDPVVEQAMGVIWNALNQAQAEQPAQQAGQSTLEAVRAFWLRHTQSNVDRMSLEDMHVEADATCYGPGTASQEVGHADD